MVWRIHHALGDGISIATVAQHILQNADGTPIDSIVPKGMMEKRQQSFHSTTSSDTNKTNMKEQQDNKENKLSWYTIVYKVVTALVQLATYPSNKVDHPTIFSQNLHYRMTHTHQRELVLLPTMPLQFVKAIKNAAGVTINDVLFTCLSQAIHDYLQNQNCPILKQQQQHLLCRAMIAAVLPRTPQSVADTLVNKWFFLSCDMGIGQHSKMDNDSTSSSSGRNIVQRLYWIHNQLGQLKQSPLPLIGLAMQNHVMPYLPDWLNQQITFRSLASHSMSISNVPGPAKTCLVAKQPAVGVQMFLSNLLPHVGLISYRDQIFGNITIDPEAIPDCHSLAPLYGNAMMELAHELKVAIPSEVTQAVEAVASANIAVKSQ